MDDREQMRLYRRLYLHVQFGAQRALEQLEETGCPCKNIQKARDLLRAALEPPDPPEKTYPALRNPPVDKRGKIG